MELTVDYVEELLLNYNFGVYLVLETIQFEDGTVYHYIVPDKYVEDYLDMVCEDLYEYGESVWVDEDEKGEITPYKVLDIQLISRVIEVE